MEIKDIIKEITDKDSIKSVYFVGCGASRSDLYPAYYFLNNNAKNLRTSIHTANEFVMATPAAVDNTAVVITCSLGGNTPETVKATSHAKSLGAHVIAVTHESGSPITEDADYTVIFAWDESYSSKMDKMIKVIEMAVELLDDVEGYAHYDEMIKGLKSSYGIIDEIVKGVGRDADEFARKYKDTNMLYVMSSGATQEVAWSFSSCLMMEMQWIPSSTFNDGDFFHGPFEMVDKDVPYLLFINEGRTREMDVRALTFLQRFDTKYTIVDSKDFALGNYFSKDIIDYLNPVIISPVIRVYAEKLAVLREHPLTKRRYMWKLSY